MSLQPDERAARIHQFETRRHNGLHKFELINRDEETRRLKLQLLFAEDESASLKEILYQKDLQHRHIKKEYDQVRAKLDGTQETIIRQDTKLKQQDIDMKSLKMEMESLQGSIRNSTKAAQNEAALTRELDKLRPELDHLRSQLANHQAVVSEKHSLQRQLDSLEVELENEKGLRKQAQEKENKSAMDELRLRAEDAEKKLALEKREREKLTKQHEKALLEISGQNGRLEERVSTMKEKIKGLQAELKDPKHQIDRQQTETNQLQSSKSKTMQRAPTNRQESKMRKAEEPSQEEATIFTPEHENQAERRLAKKRGILHATLGEKSNFSITPFLNRAKDVSEELDDARPIETPSEPSIPEPASDSEPEVKADSEVPADYSKRPKTETLTTVSADLQQPAAKKPRSRPKSKPLGETSPTKKNSAGQTGPSGAKRRYQLATESQATADQENTAPVSKVPDAKGKPGHNIGPKIADDGTKGLDGKKKRRKILGATNPSIFEEEDGEATANIANLNIGPVVAKRKRPNLGGAANAFAGASFSPLKRDRRGVDASFLG